MAKSKKHKNPSAVHLAAIQAPARTIQSRPKVESKRACRKGRWTMEDN